MTRCFLSFRHVLLVATALAGTLSAVAAAPPGTAVTSPPSALDDDPAARYLPLPISQTTVNAPQRERLRAIERGLRHRPDHPGLLAARGFILAQRGDVAAAEGDYRRALEGVGDDALAKRHVLWSLGWARFEARDDEGALGAWREAAALHGGRPYWWPYSAALAEWRLGRRDAAVTSFDAAVAGMPEWGTETGLARRTRAWPAHQVEIAQAIFTAWQASKRAAQP